MRSSQPSPRIEKNCLGVDWSCPGVNLTRLGANRTCLIGLRVDLKHPHYIIQALKQGSTCDLGTFFLTRLFEVSKPTALGEWERDQRKSLCNKALMRALATGLRLTGPSRTPPATCFRRSKWTFVVSMWCTHPSISYSQIDFVSWIE